MGERLLEPFETYGWKPNDKLSDDDNMLDLLLIVTRCSKLKQGSMACIITRPAKDEDEPLLSRIQSVANNQEMYKPKSSDIHAEVAALGDAARHGRPTDQCTAYITMPPCRKCFSALYCAGINRVVSVHQPPTHFASFGIELVGASSANAQENRARIQVFFDKGNEKPKQESGQKRKREEE
eukprot:scaffold2388_cov163-Amphora_coffeaeformis.AAC.3